MISVNYPSQQQQHQQVWPNHSNYMTNGSITTVDSQSSYSNFHSTSSMFKSDQQQKFNIANSSTPTPTSTTTSLYCPMISTILTPPSSCNVSNISKKDTGSVLNSPQTPTSINSDAAHNKFDVNKSLSEQNIYYTPITTPVKHVHSYYQNDVDNKRLNFGQQSQSHLCHPVVHYQQYPNQIQHQQQTQCHQSAVPMSGFNSFNDSVIRYSRF